MRVARPSDQSQFGMGILRKGSRTSVQRTPVRGTGGDAGCLASQPTRSAECVALVSDRRLIYFERDYLNALEVFKRTVSRHPEFPLTYRYLAATFGELRHLEEAQGALQQVKSISPASFDSYVSARPPWLRP